MLLQAPTYPFILLFISLLLKAGITIYIQDKQFDQINICVDVDEVYSASYLITKKHLLWIKSGKLNLTRNFNLEEGSFMAMRFQANPALNIKGTPVQTIDVLHWSVLHLSAYERLQRYSLDFNLKSNIIPIAHKLETTIKLIQSLKYANLLDKLKNNIPEFQRTLVIMPILINSIGTGHSDVSNRVPYLKACFWSIYKMMPNIVITVGSELEKQYLEWNVKLPFYEIIVLDHHIIGTRMDALAIATVFEAQKRFQNGQWNFDYLFYTESDQILLSRFPMRLFDYLKRYPYRVIVPHRLMPYPLPILQDLFYKNIINSIHNRNPYEWMQLSCCTDRDNCLGDRSSWLNLTESSVQVIKIFNFLVPMGNSEFRKFMFRACTLLPVNNNKRLKSCP